jgi:hypothetical protein
MTTLVTRAAMAHATATADTKTSPVFIGTVWMIDELEQALLDAAAVLTEIKAARSTQNLPKMTDFSAQLKIITRQATIMSRSLAEITEKHSAVDPQKGIDGAR